MTKGEKFLAIIKNKRNIAIGVILLNLIIIAIVIGSFITKDNDNGRKKSLANASGNILNSASGNSENKWQVYNSDVDNKDNIVNTNTPEPSASSSPNASIEPSASALSTASVVATESSVSNNTFSPSTSISKNTVNSKAKKNNI